MRCSGGPISATMTQTRKTGCIQRRLNPMIPKSNSHAAFCVSPICLILPSIASVAMKQLFGARLAGFYLRFMCSIAGSHKNEYVLFRPARCEQLDRTLIATGFLVAVGGQELDNVRQRAGPIGATEPAPLELLRRATGGDAPERFCISFGSRGSRQREDRKLAAERGVVAQRGITAHCA